MKQHSTMKTMAALALLAASLTFVACNNAYGVLSGIQTEKAQVGTTLFKNATVKAVGEDLVNYYAVMSKVYYRTFAASSWTLLPVNGVSDYYAAGFASDAASSPGRVWVASMDPTGTSLYGVYSSTDGGGNWSSALDISALSLSSSMTLDALYWAGDTLYALVHDQTNYKYSLYYSSDGSSAFATVSGYNAMDYPVIGMVKAGTQYWALTQARVYKGTTNSTFAADTTSGTPTGTIITSTSGSVLGGIAVSAAGSVLVTRSDGLLYTLPSSGTWSGGATVLDSIKLGVLAEVPTTTSNLAYRLIVAKHNSTYGYCEWNASTATEVAGNDTSAVFSPTSSGYTTTVYDKPVTALYYSAANGTILIGLAAQDSDTYALYSNTYSGSAWSGWTAE
jgi:hypothetical protein